MIDMFLLDILSHKRCNTPLSHQVGWGLHCNGPKQSMYDRNSDLTIVAIIMTETTVKKI